MADIDRDPTTISSQGHTEPISSYKGTAPLEVGLKVTVGPTSQQWHVTRVDPPDGDDAEGVFHIRRP